MSVITEEDLVARQIESEFKNAIKSEERKTKQKRKISEELKSDDPKPKKEKKQSHIIPTTPEDIHAVRQYFWTTVVSIPLLGRVALYSGLCNELMCFYSYPILLTAHKRVDKKNVAENYILGVSKPAVVLSGLRAVFAKQYPQREASDFVFWELYKINKAYYTVKVEKTSHSQDMPALQMVETKTFGGAKDSSYVHWGEEVKKKRIEKAVPVECYFSDKDFNKIKSPKIPKTSKPYPENHLKDINARVEKMKEDRLLADKKSRDALSTKAIAEAMSNLKDEESSDDSSDE